MTPSRCVSRPRALAFCLLGVLLEPAVAAAYRPFNSTDAAIAKKRAIEIELGPLGYLSEAGGHFLVIPSLILNWGFAQGWEVVLEGRQFVRLETLAAEPHLRIEDTAASLKGILRRGSMQDGAGPSIAMEVGVLLPTRHGESGTGAQGTIIASQRWRFATVHVNASAFVARSGDPGGSGGLIVEGPDRWVVRPVAEVLVEGERNATPGSSTLVGAIWRVRDNLCFDAGLRRARSRGATATELRAGLTWGFPL